MLPGIYQAATISSQMLFQVNYQVFLDIKYQQSNTH